MELALVILDIDAPWENPGSLLLGIIAAAIANGKGRSWLGWFFVGYVFTIVGIIAAAVVSDLTDPENESGASKTAKKAKAEARRAQERMRHDRSVNANRFGDIERRLDAHDVGLGLDTHTTETGQQLAGAARPPQLPDTNDAIADMTSSINGAEARTWYWSNDSVERSTASADQLRQLFQRGRISRETLLWTEGMHDWRALAELPELEEALSV